MAVLGAAVVRAAVVRAAVVRAAVVRAAVVRAAVVRVVAALMRAAVAVVVRAEAVQLSCTCTSPGCWPADHQEGASPGEAWKPREPRGGRRKAGDRICPLTATAAEWKSPVQH
jgi:hypothetical protein